MIPQWLLRLPPAWKGRALRMGFNLHPAYRATGGRLAHVSADLTHVRVSLPLNWRTRNVVGSIFGGALFAVTDGIHATLLMIGLGPDFIIWDKAASIQFKRPGRCELFADFIVDAQEIARLRTALEGCEELNPVYTVELKDRDGVVHSIVERTLYVAHKQHYKQKITAKPQAAARTAG